ncbi:hypothetical protein [Citrobacter sp. RHBSTW-00671]|uniref:hypothetical protein n=1 Tax=Citrobacter sp. RHBSTW-00671 TaxID=2742660 RepID=UPI0018066190|nr:hypothetical protein [Citrobacter sp. RHBSTW-00671]MBA7966595.1 hypothetical protein [Citrobacter sp. RHBSTW-00671]HCJ6376626.1 hypothetical protein [Citrobacter freundii]
MLTDNPKYMSDTKFSNTVQKLNAAMRQLREHQEEVRLYSGSEEFDPAPNNALGIRAHHIKTFFSSRNTGMLTEYLYGLGFVRENLIAARDVLNTEGKKKYEAYIKNAEETLSARYSGLKPYYLNILTDLMAIPFRRSTEKDRREISDSLCLIAGFIEKYRYCGTDERYRDYARTIVNGIDTEHLPPMIAGLIIQEITALVDTACATNVMTFANSGITHEEYWRFTDPDEYTEAYPDGEVPENASPLEALDVYPLHEGIAQQSLWYGLDDYVDDFIISVAGGFYYNVIPTN